MPPNLSLFLSIRTWDLLTLAFTSQLLEIFWNSAKVCEQELGKTKWGHVWPRAIPVERWPCVQCTPVLAGLHLAFCPQELVCSAPQPISEGTDLHSRPGVVRVSLQIILWTCKFPFSKQILITQWSEKVLLVFWECTYLTSINWALTVV